MPGLLGSAVVLPPAAKLGARVLLASILLVGLFFRLEHPICDWLLRVFPSEVRLLASEFTVLGAEIASHGNSEEVRVYANLSKPIELDGRTMVPFGTPGSLPGRAFELVVPLGDVFQYCIMSLVFVVAWPIASLREFIARIAFSVPLIALLQLTFPCVVVSQLWHGVRNVLSVAGPSPWTVWGDFLVGGGGWVLAMTMAAAAVIASKRLSGVSALAATDPVKAFFPPRLG